MSLFKAIANFCRESNDRDFKEENRRRNAQMAVQRSEERKAEEDRRMRASRRCCTHCGKLVGNYCIEHHVKITDWDHTVCNEFHDNQYD